MIKKIPNLQFPICNSPRGFTVIELVIYMAIFAIVLGVSVDFLFQSKTLEASVSQYQEVDRNARSALLNMTQSIRAATNVTTPALGTSASDLYLNSSAVRYFTNPSGILQKTESGITSDLTSDEVTIQNLSFTSRGELGQPATVSISFDARSNTLIYGETDYITKNFQTTVQLR